MNKPIKPRITYGDLPRAIEAAAAWGAAFERIRAMPEGTTLHGAGVIYELAEIWDDPHPPRLVLKYRERGKVKTRQVRRGDPLLLELKS